MASSITTIGKIADIFDGPHATPTKIDSGPIFLSISSLEKGRLDLSKSAFLSEDDFIKWTKRITPQMGDLLFSYETRLGEAALMPDGVRACLGRRMGLLRPKRDKVIPEYLLYAYLSPVFQQTIITKTIRGATVDRIALNEMSNFEIRIPSLNEQKKVADLLRAIDAKIELNNRINKELEAMAKTLYDYWFVQFDFPDENGKPYRSSGGLMIYNEAIKRVIPAGWRAENVLNVSELVGGGTPSKKISDYWSGDIPFYTPTDAETGVFKLDTFDHITDEGLKNCSSKLFEKGTILITARGSVGKIMIAARNMAMNQSCYALKPLPEINYSFLYFCAQSLVQHLKVKSSGSVFDSIVSNDIRLTLFAVPPLALIERFGEVMNSSFESILINTKENKQLTQLRDWLLPMLMNGQVQVN